MKYVNKGKYINSIRFKIGLGIIAVLLPAILLLCYNYFYAINTIRIQVAQSNKNTISLYINQIDSSLDDIDKYLGSLLASNVDLQTVETNKNKTQVSLALKSLSNKLNNDLTTFKSEIFLFVYSEREKYIIYATNVVFGWNEYSLLRNEIDKTVSEHLNPVQLHKKDWTVLKGDNQFYLAKVLSSGNTYIGAFVSTRGLLTELNHSNFGSDNFSLLATDSGLPLNEVDIVYEDGIELKTTEEGYYISGNTNKYLIVEQKSKKGNFIIYALCPENKVLVNFPYIEGFLIIVVAASILLIPFNYLYLRKVILHPISRMLNAMREVREGNINVKIDGSKASNEFLELDETFNSMISQIKNLKIDVYEEKLSKQKTELEHLQLQVNPHFFMNTLNIIHNLAQIKNYRLIQEMVQCLVNYFRYMFRSDISFVTLDEELGHVNNYLRIQQLRLRNRLKYEIDAPESVLGVVVPPLIIQSFVENTLKYGLISEESLYVCVKIEKNANDSDERIKIIISDSGEGFSETVLENLRLGKRIIDDRGIHVGIWNVQRRLQLLYAANASIDFRNRTPKGAEVEIIIPNQNKTGGETDCATTNC